MRRLALLAVSALAVAGCAPEQKAGEPASAATAAAPAPAQAEDVRAFKAGGLDAWALRDGGMDDVPNDNKTFGVGLTPADVSAVLQGAGLQKIALSIQPMLVRTGDRLVLLDAGAGFAFGEAGGRLPTSLRAAGFGPEQITDVVISHSHGDHVAGLMQRGGALTFPNATVHLAAAEWAYLQKNAEMAPLVKAISPKVRTFEPGAELAPGLKTFAVRGHTPGHVGVDVGTGPDAIRYVGDTVHHHVISVARPEWRVAFDGDAPTAQSSRRALLEDAAVTGKRLYAVHFPFPGIGTVTKDGEGYRWVPAP